MKKLGTIAGPVVVIGAMSAPSYADHVLLFGDHAGRDRIANILVDEGHTVTVSNELDADLENFDTIWHVGAVKAITQSQESTLVGFVRKGGGLFLTGDAYDAAKALDSSVEAIVNASVSKAGVQLDSTPESGLNWFAEFARADLSRMPNALYTWDPTVSGSIAGILETNVLTRAPNGHVTSAAWGGPDMANGHGKLIVMMDAGWVSSPYSIDRIVQNVQRFLKTGVPAVCGNAVAEEGETCDDGNVFDGDDCLTSCDVASCGDGFLEEGVETCDDLNTVGGDGCSALCGSELGPLDGNDPTDDGGDDMGGEDPIEGGGVMVPDSPDGELEDELGGGCSAGGGAGTGGFALAALALVGLVRRKRS